MVFKILFCLLFTISVTKSLSQEYIDLVTYNVDSLLIILPDQQTEERVNTLNKLATSLFYRDSKLSEKYAEEASTLAKEINYEKGIADAYRNFAYIKYYQGNYPAALNNIFESIPIYEKLDKKNTVAKMYYGIAWIHYMANNYEKAIEYGYIALDKFRERTDDGTTVGNARDTISIYGSLAETYYYLGMNDKSLELALIALDLAKRNNFSNIELMLHTWVVGANFSRGEPDSAKVYFLKALAYPDESLNMKTLKYRNTISLGWLYYNAGEIDSALYYLQTAYDFYDEKGFLYWASITSRGLGYIYYKNNELKRAEKYLQQSEKIFNEMLSKKSWYRHDSLKHIANYGLELYLPLPPVRLKEMMWNEGRIIYKLLYRLNSGKNKTSETLKNHIAYSDAKDTLNKLQRNREAIELQTRYESDRKDQQIDYLSKENEFKDTQLSQSRIILFGLAGLVLLIVILAFVLLRQNKLREQQQNLLLQQKLFRSQMNPHFLFNSLASIHNFMLNEKTVKAASYLSRFSKLVRSILNSSIEEYISLEEEIGMIENYLELQKVRFTEKFDFTLEVDESINPEVANIPSMLTQPFIENAIEHGIKQKGSKGHISVRFKKQDEVIVIEVEDDGIGRKKAEELQPKHKTGHKSLSTSITAERIQVLNKTLKKKITLLIEDLKNSKNEPTGTKVVLSIPII